MCHHSRGIFPPCLSQQALELIVSVCSILNSSPVIFLIGPRKKQFVLHSGLINSIAEDLAAMTNDGQQDECMVTMDDVDEETFTRFGEYAYKGIYHVPKPEICSSYPAATTNAVESCDKTNMKERGDNGAHRHHQPAI